MTHYLDNCCGEINSTHSQWWDWNWTQLPLRALLTKLLILKHSSSCRFRNRQKAMQESSTGKKSYVIGITSPSEILREAVDIIFKQIIFKHIKLLPFFNTDDPFFCFWYLNLRILKIVTEKKLFLMVSVSLRLYDSQLFSKILFKFSLISIRIR